MLKVWLDDIREAPEGWLWAKNMNEAINAFDEHEVTDASLDHDLGFENYDFHSVVERTYANQPIEYNSEAGTGYDFVLWILENDQWPSKTLSVHSANPVGAKAMAGVIERYGPYTERSDLIHESPSENCWGITYYVS